MQTLSAIFVAGNAEVGQPSINGWKLFSDRQLTCFTLKMAAASSGPFVPSCENCKKATICTGRNSNRQLFGHTTSKREFTIETALDILLAVPISSRYNNVPCFLSHTSLIPPPPHHIMWWHLGLRSVSVPV